MDFLPEVILLRIFRELDFDNLRHVAQVSKQWNRVAYDSALWAVTNLCGLYVGEQDFNLFVSKIADSVLCLDLRSCTGLTADVLRNILNKCHRLKTLSLQGCRLEHSMGFITILASVSSRLKNLDLRFVHGDAAKIFSRALPRMRQLEALGMDNIPSCCSAMFHFLSHLRVFYCQNCASITDDDLEGLGLSCNKLESINLSGCAYITGKFLPGLIRGCRKLKTLLLSCTRIRNQYIRETNWTDAMVTELDISYCYGITEEGLVSLLPNLTQLRYLQISFCGWGRALSDDVIRNMATRIGSNLKTLDIHSSFNMSGHALCSLLDKCPYMTTLCVGSAINSDEELEASLQCLPMLKYFFITKQSTIKTETVFTLISTYCMDIEVLALYNFYAINRSKVEETLLAMFRACPRLKTLCIRGTNVPLRTELTALASMAKVVSGRRGINICRTPNVLLSTPLNSLDNVIRSEFSNKMARF